jgi:Uma2 family endonuclease
LKRSGKQFFPGAPDLAVEILAPSNTPAEINERLQDFFGSGTQLAWIIHPEEQFVEVCHSPTSPAHSWLRRRSGRGKLLQGFQFPVADLFKEWDWE